MKYVKYMVQAALGLALSFGVMCYRGIFEAESGADRILIICDGFTVTALLFIAMGVIVYVSSAGILDVFGYALRKGAHALIPGLVRDNLTDFYEFKIEKQEERKAKGGNSTLFVGVLFLLASLALTYVWYQY